MHIEKKHCFTHSSGEDIYLFTLRNANDAEVCITNYGAIITSYKINGINIVLGFDDVRDYLSEEYLRIYPYFGCIVGRYANRIKNAAFTIDGNDFSVSKNMGEDQLHGGHEGFDKKVWQVMPLTSVAQSVSFRYMSKDGEEGFPGNLNTIITLELAENNELIITTRARTDKPTAVNLTHHDYFNMNGEGTIKNHLIKINADHYLGQDANLVTDGSFLAVKDSSHDFKDFRTVDAIWDAEGGFDQTFVFDRVSDEPFLCAECIGDKSKLHLKVYTTEPAVHFYTGRWIPSIKRNDRNLFGPYSGLCFETQKHPNAINIPHFPGTVLRPEEEYYEKTIYQVFQDEK